MWEEKWKVRWMCGFTWECSSSEAKFKTNLCYYLTTLEEKDRCYKDYGSLHSLKGKV